MDSLDTAILREMGRSRVLWWGSTDPRLAAEAIARSLRVDPTTVRARLKRWQREGFLRGHHVLPNPALVGAVIGGGSIRVDNPVVKEEVIQNLELLDGVIAVYDYVGPWMAFSMVSENEHEWERRRRLLERMTGIDEVYRCNLYGTGKCTVEPTPLDWRIIAALRANVGGSLTNAAREAGVSAKTFARRYTNLAEGGALWLTPDLDFCHYTGAVLARLTVYLTPEAEPLRVLDTLRALFPQHVQAVSYQHLGLGFSTRAVEIVIHCESIGLAEEAQKAALRLPVVSEVELLFPKRHHIFPAWFDERVEAALAKGEAPRRALSLRA